MIKKYKKLLVLLLIIIAFAFVPLGKTRAAATFTVDSTGDAQDANAGDGVCATAGAVCTFRAAIEESNALAGTDTIEFNIAGVGTHTLTPASDYPNFTETTIVDGYSQPGASENTADIDQPFNGTITIVIDGSGVTTDILRSDAQVTIRGLVLINAPEEGIQLQDGSDDSVIAGNFIGIGADGDTDSGNGANGVFIQDSATNTTVGGSSPEQRNIISGNTEAGIVIQTPNVTIQGNYIGINADGDIAAGNDNQGILIESSADSITVGGASLNQRNVIADNGGESISISTDNNVVQGNYLGLDRTGLVYYPNSSTANTGNISVAGSNNTIGGSAEGEGNFIAPPATASNLTLRFLGVGTSIGGNTVQGNFIGVDVNLDAVASGTTTGSGIALVGDTSNNLIGGSTDGEGNYIAGVGTGVTVLELTPFVPANNSIIGNTIFSSTNGAISSLGIDILESPDFGTTLVENGPTANDANDPDTGPNDYLNFPVLNSSSATAGSLDVNFDLDVPGDAPNGYRVEFFANSTADPSGYGEGEIYLGSTNVAGDVSGQTATLSIPEDFDSGTYSITATTTERDNSTDGFGATSEFAANLDDVTITAASSSSSDSNSSSSSEDKDVLADTGENSYAYLLLAILLLVSSGVYLKKKLS